jgi:hypothetical protein
MSVQYGSQPPAPDKPRAKAFGAVDSQLQSGYKSYTQTPKKFSDYTQFHVSVSMSMDEAVAYFKMLNPGWQPKVDPEPEPETTFASILPATSSQQSTSSPDPVSPAASPDLSLD